MVTKAHKCQLFDLLARNNTLKSRGFSMAYAGEGGIVVDRAGHVHGIWDHDGDGYTWVSPGSSEPRFRTDNAKSAVLYTIVVLGPE
jgi:predicted lipoprotein